MPFLSLHSFPVHQGREQAVPRQPYYSTQFTQVLYPERARPPYGSSCVKWVLADEEHAWEPCTRFEFHKFQSRRQILCSGIEVMSTVHIPK